MRDLPVTGRKSDPEFPKLAGTVNGAPCGLCVYEGDLLKGDNAWFRPVDLAVAPNGSVLVCDWYDAGVGGNRFSDQTTGVSTV
ncbi:MAG: DUF7133 domain-containing protein [Planctomycetota bacterium]|jgi:hypothetical protein